jgi:hypothetical protein
MWVREIRTSRFTWFRFRRVSSHRDWVSDSDWDSCSTDWDSDRVIQVWFLGFTRSGSRFDFGVQSFGDKGKNISNFSLLFDFAWRGKTKTFLWVIDWVWEEKGLMLGFSAEEWRGENAYVWIKTWKGKAKLEKWHVFPHRYMRLMSKQVHQNFKNATAFAFPYKCYSHWCEKASVTNFPLSHLLHRCEYPAVWHFPSGIWPLMWMSCCEMCFF